MNVVMTNPPTGKSFADVYPNLVKEWNYEKNEKSPSEYFPKSNIRVYWICPTCGYEWSATIANRTSGSSCPHCRKKSN